MPRQSAVSVIIPAFNEGPTIAAVILAALHAGYNDVLVVDDGSTDDTAQAARAAGAQVISQPNGGKGAAIHAGLSAAAGDVIVMLDADLLGLTPQHVLTLAEPVTGGSVDATIGVMSQTADVAQAFNRLNHHWSGQRAFRRSVTSDLDVQHTRYAVDLAISDCLRRHGAQIRVVKLPGLSQRTKERKVGVRQGLHDRVKMIAQVIAYRLRHARPRKPHVHKRSVRA